MKKTLTIILTASSCFCADISSIVSYLLLGNSSTQVLKSFPKAQGYGAKSKGGRGGIIYKVTNLEWNDNPGSLKYGLCSLKVPRIIVFDVSGVLNVLKHETGYLTVENSYAIVAGQTSEGGITLKMVRDGSIALRSYNANWNEGNPILYPKSRQFHDAILQNLRFCRLVSCLSRTLRAS